MTPHLRPATFALIAVMLAPFSARADRAPDATRAEALFDEGRRLMAARDFAAACPKLAESQRLDPAAGTLLNLAVCYEREGKTATAWATYKSAALAAQRAGEPDRSAAAARKASELEPRLSRLTFSVTPVPGLEVRCDGEPVREPSWGIALPYDPGSHDVEASAPGHQSWSVRVELAADGRRLSVAVPRLDALAFVTPVAEGGAPRSAGGTQRVLGGILAAMGVVGVGVGVYTGLHARSIYNDALAQCGGTTVCSDQHGIDTRNEAGSWATGATVAFIASGAAIAGGALLYFTAPRGNASGLAVGVSPMGTGLAVTGRF